MDNAAQAPECRRKTLRIDTDLTMFLKTSEGLIKAVVKNISEGGVFVQTDHLLDIATNLTLHLFLPDVSNASIVKEIEVKGVITWVNPKELHWAQKGMGIKFLEMTKDKADPIKNFVKALIKENKS